MKKYEHLPFEVILSATEGDPEAIETVMKFYDGYISKLCLRKLYDEHGNVCMVVDADLKNRVRTALLDMLMNFEISNINFCYIFGMVGFVFLGSVVTVWIRQA